MGGAQRVSTCLWFNTEAEDAARFYTSLLPNSSINGVSRYGKGAPMPEGTPIMVSFQLAGTPYLGLNGGPHFTHSEACSIVVSCDSQDEIDRLWTAFISDGGTEQRCFWLKDRFGLSWQIVPSKMGEWMESADPVAGARVFSTMMTQVKADIAALEAAYNGH